MGCADILYARAREVGAEVGIAALADYLDLIHSADIEAILNLTPPNEHYGITVSALHHGLHVFSEKPLALTMGEAYEIVRLSSKAGLVVGCAPDTFLAKPFQAAMRAVDQGAIGLPLYAEAHFLGAGPESWHPRPEIFYREGGGPLLDMGPYYVTILACLLGSVSAVTGFNGSRGSLRDLVQGPLKGQKLSAEVPTHCCGLLQFETGAIASLITSFDFSQLDEASIRVYGTRGILLISDPESYTGRVEIQTAGAESRFLIYDSREMGPLARGLGLVDLSRAVRGKGICHASAELACHVLEVLQAVSLAGDTGRAVKITTPCPSSAALRWDSI
jgi:predicted dehydrogenase